ncbi:hypothetical protein KM427_09780 [Nocardioides sp. LMS-CY]|uniref:Ig-like domain-containing protein n=1 Tax=Nocardioides sp. (strain LMS-CY) TaxID=2840457 RepID=UPI001C00494E|nr:Ig-like domain-containing protein [Nocardioides sp. LMS-CY]QWF23947.1 hypothetical protein KM427_09780 [Nocardioides sp. LMS-CY]
MSALESRGRGLPTTRRRGGVRRLLAAGATGALALGALVAVAPTAGASECSSQTGGSNDWVMWTGGGFTCGYQAKSGKKKIGSFNTQTWTHSTALGYTKRDHRWKQTGGVKVSYMYYGSDLGSSITFTAFNSEDGSRHWGATTIWNTAKGGTVSSSQYKGDDYEYKTNRFHVSKISVTGASTTTPGTPASYSVKVTDPDGGTTPGGTIALLLQPGSKPDPTKTDCDGKVTSQGTDTGLAQGALSGGTGTLKTPGLAAGTYTLYAVYAGSVNSKGRPLYCDSPSKEGLTAAQSSSWTLTVTPAARTAAGSAVLSAPGETVTPDADVPGLRRAGATPPLVVVDRAYVAGPRGGAPARRLACPAAWVPVQVNASSPTRVLPEQLFAGTGTKQGIPAGTVPAGTRVDAQVVCRRGTAGVRTLGRTVLGSARTDRLTTRRPDSTVLAGRGDDHVVVSTRGSAAFGFTGADRIVVTAARGAAHGGPGADVLVARTPGTVLLVGGSGPDRLVGAAGRTLINARDGAGGDHVVCRSAANLVLADAGDRIEGPCTVR